MGREIKRVPLDFDWPLNKVWDGFLNPLHVAKKCTACDGSGSSPEARHLKDLWYGYAPFRPEDRGGTPFQPDDFIVRSHAERNVERAPEFYGTGESAVSMEARRLCRLFNSQWSHHLSQGDVDALVDEGRLVDFTHEWRSGEGWVEKIPAYRPTAAEVNEWSLNGFGHDSINQWIVVGAECDRLGIPHYCAMCEGEGELWPSPEAKAAYDAWEPTEPPAGDGWQLWETVSEGSPISPVFATADELVWHIVIDGGYSEEGARAFVAAGWAPSFVMDSERGVMSGVEASRFTRDAEGRG